MAERRLRKFRWWHGAAFYVGVQAAALGLRKAAETADRRARRRSRGKDDREMYEAERLPVFAPPGAAFPIAWSINCASRIAAGLHVLNLPQETPGRREFLRLEACSWGLFALFETAYFGLNSPINAELVTLAYTGVTAASLQTALGRMKDPKAAWLLGTTAAWLVLANPVGVAQAAWNRDPFWKVGPFCEPPKGWEKKPRTRGKM